MTIPDRYKVPSLGVLVLIALFLADGYRPSYPGNPELSTAVFYVN